MTLSLFAETFKHSGKFLASAVVLQHEASSQHINQVLPTFNFLLSIYSNSGEMGQWIFQFVVEYDTTIIHHRMLSTHHKRYFLICIVGVFSKSLKNNFVNCKLTHNYGPYGCFFNLIFQMKKKYFCPSRPAANFRGKSVRNSQKWKRWNILFLFNKLCSRYLLILIQCL